MHYYSRDLALVHARGFGQHADRCAPGILDSWRADDGVHGGVARQRRGAEHERLVRRHERDRCRRESGRAPGPARAHR